MIALRSGGALISRNSPPLIGINAGPSPSATLRREMEAAMRPTTPAETIPVEPAPGLGVVALDETARIGAAVGATLSLEPLRYLKGLAQDLACAALDLSGCRSPFEIIAVQQKYALARSRFWTDSNLRFLESCLCGNAPDLAADNPRDPFILPD